MVIIMRVNLKMNFQKDKESGIKLKEFVLKENTFKKLINKLKKLIIEF